MFLIWVGKNSEADAIVVCKDENIAKAYAKLNNGYVTEAPLITDESYIQKANDLIHEWKFIFYLDSSCLRIGSADNKYIESSEKKEDDLTTYPNNVILYVYTDDKKEAEKIAWDRAYKIQAERLGL